MDLDYQRLSHYVKSGRQRKTDTIRYHLYCSSLAKLCAVLQLHGLQHARLPCPSLSPGDVCARSLSHVSTHVTPRDCSPPGSYVHGISKVRILECVDISFSKGSSWLRDRTHISCISCVGRWILYHECPLGSPHYVLESAQIHVHWVVDAV